MSTCCICQVDFKARNSYSVCGKCYSSDRLRAFDKVESAIHQARRNGITPVTLTVIEWLSVLADFSGNCAMCRKVTGTKILRFDRTKGFATLI
jgi:hypothetical protein